MKRNADIINELRTISPLLAGIDPMPVQTVPGGFFDQLPDRVLTRVRNEWDEKPASVPDSAVPSGYFEQLPGRILDRIRSAAVESPADTEELPTVLAGLSRTMPQEVPEGYFEGLADRALSQIAPPAPVVKMGSRLSWVRYAVAASLTGMLLFSAWYLLSDRQAGQSQAGDMAGIAAPVNPVDTLQVSDTDLAGFLEENQGLENLNNAEPLSASNTDLALLDLDEQRIRDILRTVPDNALADYIHENPEDNNVNSSN